MRTIETLRWMLMVCAMVVASPFAFADEAKTSLAELPHWPFGWDMPDDLRPGAKNPKDTNADIMAWLPPGEGAARVRAVMLVPNNTDSKDYVQHGKLREVAAKHGMAIVYMRRYNTGIESAPADYRKEPSDITRVPQLLKWVAEQTGVPAIEHAPWITFGKSSRGSFPFRAAWIYPERMIASMSYHGETPTWPLPDWAKEQDQSILHLSTNGETEWGGTWFVHVRPCLLNYHRHTAWLPHVLVVRGVGHGDYSDKDAARMPRPRVWDYMSLFVDKALTLRLPEDADPSKGPVTLRKVDASKGYLVDPFAVEQMFRVPHFPLVEKGDQYVSGGAAKAPVSGYAKLSPAKDYDVPEGVPVVQPNLEVQGFKDWLMTEHKRMLMKDDPMHSLGDLAKLQPKPGDTVTIDGTTFTFRRSESKDIAPEGGLRVNSDRLTFLAYTVLEVKEAGHFKVVAPYTPATRQQMVLNGRPVQHEQVIHLEAGRYPLLHVVRMSVKWGRVGPWLEAVSDEHVALAKQLQEEADERAREQARLDAEAGSEAKPVIFPAASVPADERSRHFWVADEELARAWVKMHEPLNRP